MAKFKDTVTVTGIMTPTDTDDKYAVVGAEHVKGGLRQVENEAALANIPEPHLVEGMIAYLVTEGVFKMWKKDPNDNDTLKWMDADMGGGASKNPVVHNVENEAKRDEKFPPDTLDQVDLGTLVYIQDQKKFQVLGTGVSGREWQDVYEEVVHPYRVVDDVQTIKDSLAEGEMVYDKATGKLWIKGSGDTILDLNEKVDRPYKIVDDILQVQADTVEEGTMLYDKATDKLYVKGNDAFLEVQPEVVHPYIVIDDEAGRPDPAEVGTLVFQKDVNQFFVKLATEWKAVHEEVTHPYYIVESEDKLVDINSPEVGSLVYITGTDSFKVYKRNPDQVDTQAPDAYTWQEAKMGGGGDTYTNQTPTPEKVGGIEKGTTFDGKTMEEILNMLLYPYQAPSFTTFSLAGARVFEIGETFTPTTMSWGISNPTNAKLDTIAASFNGQAINIDAGSKTANGNNVTMTGANPVSKNTPATISASITAQNSKGQNFSKTTSVSWSYKTFTLTKATDTIVPGDVTGAGNFASSPTGVHNFTGAGYEFYVYPAAWNTIDTLKVKDNGTNMGFACNTTHPNITLSRNGVDVEYKVLRSSNFLNSNVSMRVEG